jgi:tRNA (guanine-N7-)-methyltransferase
MTNEEPTHRREIRSFVLRAGRMTDAQRRALEQDWPRFGIDFVPGATIDLDACFGRLAPHVVEIGFGNGETLTALASADPARDYLGVEVHAPGVGHLLRIAAQRELRNLRVIRHDAVEVLRDALAPDSLDAVLILFPDPWHKKRHNKRRLVQGPLLDLLASRLRPGGELALATDWEPYAQQMLELLSVHPRFRNLAPGGTGYAPRPAWRVPTRFERRGQRLGHGVRDLAFARC